MFRGSSSSFSGSRPLIPFPVNHSDSAIGSSLDGSFSCSFLPPPPPYRPPCSLIESGSDGILGSQQHNKTPQGKDFTSLLGFDTLILPSAINRSVSEEEQNSKQPHTKTKTLKRDGLNFSSQHGPISRNNDINNHSLISNCSINNFFAMTDEKQHVSSNTQTSLSHIFEESSLKLEQVSVPKNLNKISILTK